MASGGVAEYLPSVSELVLPITKKDTAMLVALDARVSPGSPELTPTLPSHRCPHCCWPCHPTCKAIEHSPVVHHQGQKAQARKAFPVHFGKLVGLLCFCFGGDGKPVPVKQTVSCFVFFSPFLSVSSCQYFKTGCMLMLCWW